MHRSFVIVMVALALLTGATWFAVRAPAPAPSSPRIDESDADRYSEQSRHAAPEPGLEAVVDDVVSARGPEAQSAEPECRPVDIGNMSHPIVASELERLALVLPMGPEFEAYRGLDAVTLEGAANGGDSIAMMLLGARAMMLLETAEPDDPVGYFNGRERIRGGRDRQLTEAERIDYLDQAAAWFYNAALHGRMFALEPYSSALEKRFKDPVELGWIDREAYDALSSNERAALSPSDVMLAALFDLEPSLRTGLFGLALEKFGPEIYGKPETRELTRPVREEFVRIFRETRQSMGLRPPLIAPSRYSEDELRRALCMHATD